MLPCPDQEKLDQHRAGRLGREEAARVDEHLEDCAACSELYDRLATDQSLLHDVRRALEDRPLPSDPPTPLADPPRLSRYRIVRRLGEGGMGIVYEAEQKNPRRSVALKIVRPGARFSESLLRRFELEAQVLGRLDHPGIARIYEADSFDTGDGPQPFFAMELVHGQPLDRAAASLELREKLELFVDICAAVQHAHQKAVIHRDLKPQNILVTKDHQPKILDFGIARTLDADVRSTELRTQTGQVFGTLATMSPEQVSGDPTVIDTRTDVYALGAILYQLLTGELPFAISGKPFLEAARIIREQEPEPLRNHDRLLPADLETIVSTALAKDKDRRYASAAALAADVRRYLRAEPITARTPSTFYQLSKFAQRHRGLVAGASAFVLAVIAGLVTTTMQMVRARDAEEEARSLAHEAVAGQAAAQREARIAKKISDLLQELLLQASPEQVRGDGEVTLRQILEEAARRAGVDLADEPSVEAQLRVTLGRAFLGLSDYKSAREHLERALSLLDGLPEKRPETRATALNSLGDLAIREGNFEEAERLLDEVADPSDGGPDLSPILLATNLNNLAIARYFRGELAQAEPLFRRALDFHRKEGDGLSANAGTTMANLAKLLIDLERVGEAEQMLEEALPILEATVGSSNPHLASALLKLGEVLLIRGEREEALRSAERAHAIYRERLGPEDPRTLMARVALGQIHRSRQENEAAVEELSLAAEGLRRRLGAEHPTTLEARALLAKALLGAGRETQASEDHLRRFLQGSGGDGTDPTDLRVRVELGRVLLTRGALEEAEEALRRCVELGATTFADEPAERVRVTTLHARSLAELGRHEEAIGVLEACLGSVAAELVADHPAHLALTEQLGELQADRR